MIIKAMLSTKIPLKSYLESTGDTNDGASNTLAPTMSTNTQGYWIAFLHNSSHFQDM